MAGETATQDVALPALAVGVLDQLHVDPGLNFLPVGLLQQLALKMTQPSFGCAHEVKGFALAQVVEIVLADHAAIHGPDPFSAAVLSLHQIHDLLDRGHLRAVAGEHFRGQRQALGCHDQTDAHLLAVRTAVAAVTALSLGVALALRNRSAGAPVRGRPSSNRLLTIV